MVVCSPRSTRSSLSIFSDTPSVLSASLAARLTTTLLEQQCSEQETEEVRVACRETANKGASRASSLKQHSEEGEKGLKSSSRGSEARSCSTATAGADTEEASESTLPKKVVAISRKEISVLLATGTEAEAEAEAEAACS